MSHSMHITICQWKWTTQWTFISITEQLCSELQEAHHTTDQMYPFLKQGKISDDSIVRHHWSLLERICLVLMSSPTVSTAAHHLM